MNDATEAEIKRARELYETDDIQIDENATTSRAYGNPDGGLWVAAWVWLADKEMEDESNATSKND